MRVKPPEPAADVAAAALLAVATIAFLAALPHDLWTSDEGRYLYEAKRVLDGDVPYRDFFDFVSPGLWYLFAAAFRCFGTTIATAKVVAAVFHGGTVAVLFLICRAAGVRRALAAAAALAHVALCESVWPFVSPHWIGTFLSMVLVLVALRGPWDESPVWAAALGAVTGLLVLVVQHKGALFALGIGFLFLLDRLVRRRFRVAPSSLTAQLACDLGALALVTLPVLALLVAKAGAWRVFDALVVFPLVDYRTFPGHATVWGYSHVTARINVYTLPPALAYCPAALLPLLARAVWCWWRRAEREELRRIVVLAVFALLSIGSILNYPGIAHLAFIAPLFAVLAAVDVEIVLRPLAEPWRRRSGAAVAALLLAALALKIGRNTERRLKEFPLRHETAFGVVSFHDPARITLLEAVRQRLRDAGTNELFCYPACADLYLLSGAANPTPHQWLQRGLYRSSHFEETLAALKARRIPYVVATTLLLGRDDPVLQYLRAHYERVDIGLGPFDPKLFRRVATRPEAKGPARL